MPDARKIRDELKMAPVFVLDPSVVNNWYLKLPGTFKYNFGQLGTGNTTPPPASPTPSTDSALPVIAGMTGQLLQSYQEYATKLDNAMQELLSVDKGMPAIADATKDIAQGARDSINNTIDTMHTNALSGPTADYTETTWVMKFISDASVDLCSVMDQTKSKLLDQAGGAAGLASNMNAFQAQMAALQQQEATDAASFKSRLDALNGAGNGNAGNGNAGNGNAGNGNAGNGSGDNTAADLLKDLGLSPLGGPDSGKNGVSNSPTAPGNDGTSNTPGVNTPGANTSDNGLNLPGNSSGAPGNGGQNYPINDSTGGAGNIPVQAGSNQDGYNASPISDLSSLAMLSAIPNMLESMNQGIGQDPALNAAYRMPQQPLPAAPLTPPPGTTPAAPVTEALAPQSVTPDASNPGTPPSATSVMPAPDADGGVLYTYPDGKSQRVCATVWKALDAAFHDPTVLDARQAYGKTSSSWSDDKHIGDPKDPYELITGDVVVWEDPSKTAIVRRLDGASEDDALEVIVDKRVQPYADEMSDSTGSFKGFGGFARPRGITAPGKSADPDSSTPTGLPTDDPSAALNAAALPTTI
ncbi:hypothetical protein [Nocardia heshunensis]